MPGAVSFATTKKLGLQVRHPFGAQAFFLYKTVLVIFTEQERNPQRYCASVNFVVTLRVQRWVQGSQRCGCLCLSNPLNKGDPCFGQGRSGCPGSQPVHGAGSWLGREGLSDLSQVLPGRRGQCHGRGACLDCADLGCQVRDRVPVFGGDESKDGACTLPTPGDLVCPRRRWWNGLFGAETRSCSWSTQAVLCAA